MLPKKPISISVSGIQSQWFAITHMPAILKTYLPSQLLTILEAHQETELEEMLTPSVEGLPFCSDLKNIQSCEIYFGSERPHKSD